MQVKTLSTSRYNTTNASSMYVDYLVVAGGGGGGGTSTGGAGGSGIVILKYLSSFTSTFSAGIAVSTITSAGYKISTITAGTGTVTFTL